MQVFKKEFQISKNKSTFNKGIFTLCDYRKNDKCPPWQIQSTKILHDNKKKTIYYNESIRSYVFINDLVRFLNLVLIYKKNITINFCSNEKYYIYQIYKMIIKKLKFQRKFMKPNSNADGIFFDNKFFISHFPNFKFTKINKSLDIILKK